MRGGQKENDTIAGQHMETRDGDGNRRRLLDRTKTRNSPYTYTSLSNASELPIPARSTTNKRKVVENTMSQTSGGKKWTGWEDPVAHGRLSVSVTTTQAAEREQTNCRNNST